MIDILSILPPPPPVIRVLDVGAAPAGPEVYEPLRAAGIARVVGFEPHRDACGELNATHGPQGHKYHPYFVGDGSARTFHATKDGYSSSLYEPNLELVSQFQELGESYQVVRSGAVQTRRLDDLPDLGGAIEVAKLDVQGAELDVIRGGPRTIGAALVVHAEVAFVPMYKNQPLFADVDAALRDLGFSFLRFNSLFGRPFVPLMMNDISNRISQMLWADVVYVRDFMKLAALSPTEQLKLAVIVHMMYGAVDLAHVALAHHDRATGSNLADRYLRALKEERSK